MIGGAITRNSALCATELPAYCSSRVNLGFPKSKRLTRAADFDRVKKEGRVQRGALVTLSVLKDVDPEEAGFRAGFITSRRVGGAVERNRVRRRLRDIVRRHQHNFRAGFWIVIIARAAATRASYRELEDEWLRLARHASILAP